MPAPGPSSPRPRDERHLDRTDVALEIPFPPAETLRQLNLPNNIWFHPETRRWYFRPSEDRPSLPGELIAFLPKPPAAEQGRTYLQWKLSREDARNNKLTWDASTKLYYAACSPDLLPRDLHSHLPQRFSWAAWNQSRFDPARLPCRAPLNNELNPTTTEFDLATEIFRSHFADNYGFLAVMPASPARSLSIWISTLIACRAQPGLIVVVTTPPMLLSWRRIVSSVGTGPNDCIVLCYDDLASLSSSRSNTAIFQQIFPVFVIWDDAQMLRNPRTNYSRAATSLARRTFNLWVSANPAASARELHYLAPLIKRAADPESHEDANAWVATHFTEGDNDRWISWRRSETRSAISTRLHRLLFQRDARGTLSGSLTEFDARQPFHVYYLAISPEIETSWATQIARSYLLDQYHVVIVSLDDTEIESIASELRVHCPTTTTLPRSTKTPPAVSEWIAQNRCSLIHQTHLRHGPIPANPRPRVIIDLTTSMTAADIALNAPLAGQRTLLLIPYLLNSPSASSIATIDLDATAAACSEAIGETTIESF